MADEIMDNVTPEPVGISINEDTKPESELTPEEKQARVELGIDNEGFLRVKVHVSLGKWNLWGVLKDAEVLVLGYFAKLKREEMEKSAKSLVRPNGLLKGFRNRWR